MTEQSEQSSNEDLVNHPSHYLEGKKLETIQRIELALTDEEFIGYLKGSQIKYEDRYRKKGGRIDLEKKMWYLKKQIAFEFDRVHTEVYTVQDMEPTALSNDWLRTKWPEYETREPNGGLKGEDDENGNG